MGDFFEHANMKALTVFLVACLASAQAGKMYRWRWDSNWLNNDNWADGAPVDGPYNVRFPAEFSSFNNGRGAAVYLGPTNCASGASSCSAAQQIRASRSNMDGQGFRSSVRIRRLVMPSSGKVTLGGDFKVNFMQNVAMRDEMDVQFQMKSKTMQDWQCAYNWVFLRDNGDPEIPDNFEASAIAANTM